MSYITFDYYKNTYKGFKISPDKFGYYSDRASEKIDYYTNSDIQTAIDDGEDATAIKKACCAVTDLLYQQENEKAVSSEKTLTYQVSYDISKNKSVEQKIYNVMSEYLVNTGLMFRGC